MNILEHPEYLDAVSRECDSRDAAFLGLNESIAGYECQPLRLWHVMALRIMRSPLLGSGTPNPVELAAFLWLVSVDYQPGKAKARTAHLKRCREFQVTPPPQFGWLIPLWSKQTIEKAQRFCEVEKAARNYIDAAFAESIESGTHSLSETRYFSNAASFCAFLSKDYAIPADRALQLPVKQYFQFARRSEKTANPCASFTNPSRTVLDRLVTDLNRTNN